MTLKFLLLHDYVPFVINFSLSSLLYIPIWSINFLVEAACILEVPMGESQLLARSGPRRALCTRIHLSCIGDVTSSSLFCLSPGPCTGFVWGPTLGQRRLKRKEDTSPHFSLQWGSPKDRVRSQDWGLLLGKVFSPLSKQGKRNIPQPSIFLWQDPLLGEEARFRSGERFNILQSRNWTGVISAITVQTQAT